ncbi:hypothetical protein [Azohydromonas lata]|uniref:hypothetical protein n=1 Tax=Azohydromonas lata TaxID=45677 RepID=UPI0012F4B326|nr:hypothetical protein [Azohydromonas lata]
MFAMQTDARAVLPQQQATESLWRMELALEDINARIARLSIALRAPLETNADVDHVLQRRPAAAVENDRRSGQHAAHDGPERRVAHKWEELRGLLVLRYQLCSRLAAAVGAPAVHQLLMAADAQLQREGFGSTPAGMAL